MGQASLCSQFRLIRQIRLLHGLKPPGDNAEAKTEYGDLEGLHRETRDSQELERHLQAFKGVEPVGVNILSGSYRKSGVRQNRSLPAWL